MRYYILISISFILGLQLNSQCITNPDDYVDEHPLENRHRSSRIYTPVYITGDYDNTESYSLLEEQPLFNVGFVKSLWAGGADPAGNLKFTGVDYVQGDFDGIVTGPISDNSIEGFCDFYSNIWFVSGQEITFLKNRFANGELRIEDISEDILTWPAKSNPHNGELAVDYDMAPFFDFNADDIYNPLDGDYPVAVQEQVDLIPLAFNFSIYSSNVDQVNTGFVPIELEFHQVNYVFDCSGLSEANHSVFTNVKISYKGNVDLKDARIGLWEDMDLGCYENDYHGCAPELNATFTYNDGSNENLCLPFVNGLTEPGAALQTMVFLNADIQSYLVYDNPGVGSNPPQTADPQTMREYYNYLNGIWLDGTPLTIGGSGFNPNSNNQTNIQYKDLPNNPNGWSMASEGIGVNDKRTITAIYDGDLIPGQQLNFHFADHIKYSPSHNHLSIFDIYEETVNQLKNEHQELLLNGNIDCQYEVCEDDCVWPGDVDGDGITDGKDILIMGQFISGIDSIGPSRQKVSHYWSPVGSEGWSFEQNNINAKYADVSGNGIINRSDIDILELNFGKTNEKYVDAYKEIKEVDDLNLNIEMDVSELTWPNQSLFDNLFEFEINLIKEAQTQEKIRGISFKIELDTLLIYPFDRNTYRLNFQVDYSYSQLDEIPQDNEFNEANIVGKSSIVITNLDQNEIAENDIIISNTFKLRNQATTTNLDGIDTITFKIYDAYAMTTDGELIEMGIIHQDLIVRNLPVVTTTSIDGLTENTPSYKIYPNPLSNEVEINMNTPKTGNIRVYNMSGQTLLKRNFRSKSILKLDLTALKAGVYILEVKGEGDQIFSEKIIKF